MSDDETQRDDVEEELASPASPVVYVVQSDYDRIAVQRNHSVSRINSIINTMNHFQADRMALETRRDMLKECYKAYNLAQSTLEQWNPDDCTSRDEVEVTYVNGLTTFEKAIAAKTREENKSCTGNKDGVRLPAIDLPVFSGHGENWLEWFDKFNTLIHNRASLAMVQKFEYLKLSLRGAALGLIDSLPTTEDNYSIAYELIERRYNNPKLLVHNHTRELFELKSIDVESATGLRNLFDSARKHLRCLENLKQPVTSWDAILIYLMANKLDPTTRREWESVASGTTPPLYKQLENFVFERCQMLDAMPLKRKSTPDSNNLTHKKIKTEVKAFTITKPPTSQRCSCCGAYHFIGSCIRYRAKSVEEKIRIIKKASLCYNCLRSGHNAEQCRSGNCMKCDRKHHTSIHREKRTSATNEHEHPTRIGKQLNGKSNQSNDTILPTASVLVVANGGVSVASRALLDSGSQSNFATTSFIRRVGIVTKRVNCQIAGFGKFLQPIREVATISFKSRTSNYRKSVSALVTDSITGLLPSNDVNVDGWNIADVNLADPEFHLSRPVDMLLGTTVLFDILRSGNTAIGEGLPFMQNTELGWIIGGNVKRINENQSLTQFMNENVNNFLCRDWTDEETICEQYFVETTTRTPSGRFSVRLPLKPTVSELGESKTLALDKFLRLEKRFERDPELQREYVAFMTDYLRLGHMERVDRRHSCGDGPVFYFPHHAVLRPESSTTKLRTVFNGSATTSSGVSLNDVLMTGPPLQQDIFNILLRFRCHRYVLTADIKKMFRQIEVQEQDRQLQLILWRFTPEDPVSTYRLNTVTYGTCSAPFIAARCLKQLSLDFEDEYPEACRVIRMDFYMDDALTGHDQIERLVEVKEQLMTILSSAGFELHKWKSNEPSLAGEDEGSDSVKILGLRWDTQADQFSFDNDVNAQTGLTKRSILSEVQKIYDPLGILSPIVIHGKLVMQNIWANKLEWDEPLPEQVAEEWKWFCEQIAELHTISFARYVVTTDGPIELHGFSDAAKRAYGAVVYVRTVVKGKVHVNLLCAKSRIAPTAEQSKQEDSTIPRMELRAATLLVELMTKVKETVNLVIQGVYYWTDSTVVLDWISQPHKRWPPFVSNRVIKINELSSVREWNHVRSKQNPADLISRGTSSKKLADSKLWWTGPEFLLDPIQPWEKATVRNLLTTADPESKEAIDIRDYTLLDRYSSFSKLQRVMAYCLRFKRNCLNKSDRIVGHLTLAELKQAHNQIVRMVQQQHFSKEVNHLALGKPVSASSSLITMEPFLDNDGLLRLGGRLQASEMVFDQQHPIILPNRCNVTWLIAVQHHHANLHLGPQSLLYALRLKYWPIHGRSLTRKVVHKCITCFRNTPKTMNQIMGRMPGVRVTPGRPFQTCGVDFGGPFTIKENFVRTKKTLKVYVALFICLRTRAVHLELVSSLSSASFIAALRRFTSQRGRCNVIYCDNATNFVGSKNEIKTIAATFEQEVEPKIRDFCIIEEIDWKFIPPRSPNFGGIWEAGIKSVKQHMKRVLGCSMPTYEEMLTLLKQIEGCLNSRPISPLSADPRDPIPLTPAHFLIGGPIIALPDVDIAETPSSRLTRLEEVQKNLQLFWKRWRHEYLNHLQQRSKKFASVHPNLLVGQLCLVKDDNLPSCSWITGRVIKVHPGPDGHVRVATLHTSKGEIKRSISKLCILPLDD